MISQMTNKMASSHMGSLPFRLFGLSHPSEHACESLKSHAASIA